MGSVFPPVPLWRQVGVKQVYRTHSVSEVKSNKREREEQIGYTHKREKKERQTDRQTDRQTETETDRQIETETDRDKDTDRDRDTKTQIETQTDGQTDRQKQRQRRHTERANAPKVALLTQAMNRTLFARGCCVVQGFIRHIRGVARMFASVWIVR